MEKTIVIDNKPVTFKASGGVLLKYKEQFGSEYFDDTAKLRDLGVKIKESNSKVDMDEYYTLYVRVGFQLAWVMAKLADKTIPSPEVWLDSFEDFPLVETILPEISELFNNSISTGNKGESDGEPIRAENFLACCLLCGLTTEDVNEMSLGFLINTIRENVEIKSGKSEDKPRKATQNDFDSF